MTARTDHRPARRAPRAFEAPGLTALVWAAIALAPVLLLVENTGPRALNLVLRGLWVAIVAAVAVWVLARVVSARRSGAGPDRGAGS